MRRMTILIGGLWLALASAAPAQERMLSKQIVVPAPIEAVWEAWTTSAGIESFLAPEAEVEARVGGAFHVHFDPLAAPGAKGADDMRVMALQKPTLLSFDWNAPPHLAQIRQQRTFIVVRLKELDAKSTQVQLTHIGWGDGGEWDLTYNYFDRAWSNVLANLRQRFEVGPTDWSSWMAQLHKFHETAPAASPK